MAVGQSLALDLGDTGHITLRIIVVDCFPHSLHLYGLAFNVDNVV